LFAKNRFDGAVYICGYAVEVILKRKICQRLNWAEYPISDSYKSFKTHNLDVLLHLSGKEAILKSKCLAEWSFVFDLWNPELRYQPIGKIDRIKAQTMINYSKAIYRNL